MTKAICTACNKKQEVVRGWSGNVIANHTAKVTLKDGRTIRSGCRGGGAKVS